MPDTNNPIPWTADERTAYALGKAHAYRSVFKAFQTAFDTHEDTHALFDRITAQWDHIKDNLSERGPV